MLERDAQHKKIETKYGQVQSKYKQAQSEVEKAQSEVTRLSFMVKKLQSMLFGSKRERFENDAHSDQLNLPFEELEAKSETTTDLPVKETITYQRAKNENHKGRNRIPDDLPVHEIQIEPSEDTTGLVK